MHTTEQRRVEQVFIDDNGEVILPEDDRHPAHMNVANLPSAPAAPAVPNPQDDNALDEVIAELGGDAAQSKIVIYKQEDDSGKMVYCKRLSVTEFRRTGGIDWARRKWGGGEFEFRIIRPGHIGIFKRFEMALAVDPDDVVKDLPVSQNNDFSSAIAMLSETMMRGFQQMSEMVAQSRAPQKTTTDTLNELMLMRQVLGGTEKSTLTPEVLFSVLQKGMDFGRESSGGEGGAHDSFISLAREFMPLLSTALEKMPKTTEGEFQPNPIPQQLAPAKPSAAPKVSQTEEEKMGIIMRMALSRLLKVASKSGDPAVYAQVLLDELPESAYDSLIEMLNADDWFKALQLLNPGVTPFNEWFGVLRMEILATLVDDSEPEPLTPDAKTAENAADVETQGKVDQMTGDATPATD